MSLEDGDTYVYFETALLRWYERLLISFVTEANPDYFAAVLLALVPWDKHAEYHDKFQQEKWRIGPERFRSVMESKVLGEFGLKKVARVIQKKCTRNI